MRIFKREDTNTWSYDIKIDGVRKRKSGFKTKTEAKLAAQERLESNAPSKEYSFFEFYTHWIELTKKDHISKKAYQKYVSALSHFSDYHGKTIKVNNITRSMYQEFLNDYAKTRSKETVRKLHNCLSAAFTEAVHQRLIVTSPTHGAKLSGVTPPSDTVKFTEDEDFNNIREIVMSKYTKSHLILFLLIVSGARFGEINALTQDDIIGDHTIRIRGTKTEAAKRDVMIAKEDMLYLKEGIEELELHDYKLFGLSHNAVSDAFKRIQRRLGINEDNPLTMHSIRHTHASQLIYEGIDINYVSERLGHANKAITLEIYTHLLTEHKRAEERKTVDYLARKWHDK